jgi:hypothetical protein
MDSSAVNLLGMKRGDIEMSLAIPVDTVVAVMLEDGWHYVIENSFEIDSFEFMRGDDLRLGRGTVEGVSATGARWKEADGFLVSCQVPQILAVKYR